MTNDHKNRQDKRDKYSWDDSPTSTSGRSWLVIGADCAVDVADDRLVHLFRVLKGRKRSKNLEDVLTQPLSPTIEQIGNRTVEDEGRKIAQAPQRGPIFNAVNALGDGLKELGQLLRGMAKDVENITRDTQSSQRLYLLSMPLV